MIGWHKAINFQGFVRLIQTSWGAGHIDAKMLLDIHQMELAGCLFSIFCLKGRACFLVCFAFYLMNGRYYIKNQVDVSLIWSQSSWFVGLCTQQGMKNILLNLWGPKGSGLCSAHDPTVCWWFCTSRGISHWQSQVRLPTIYPLGCGPSPDPA